MKITIELEGFAVRFLVVLPLAVWCVLKGQTEVVAAAAALITALKP